MKKIKITPSLFFFVLFFIPFLSFSKYVEVPYRPQPTGESETQAKGFFSDLVKSGVSQPRREDIERLTFHLNQILGPRGSSSSNKSPSKKSGSVE